MDVWGSVGALEWQPESAGAVGSAAVERPPESESADEWRPELKDASGWQLEQSVWQPESERKSDISKSANAQESHPDSLDFKENLKWPDDFELEWPEDQEFQETEETAEIKEAVQCLREGMTESGRQANEERAQWIPRRAGRLAEDFRKIEEATSSWRRLGWRKMRMQQAADSWKRHSTSDERRKMWIRGQRARSEAVRRNQEVIE
jgi:hypothetical protein